MSTHIKSPNDASGCGDYLTTRRQFLTKTAAGAALSMMPTTAFSSLSRSKDPRFLTIILRGALDGLAAVPPIGDPDYRSLREGFELTSKNTLPLDDFFALNNNMKNLAKLYQQKDALVVHAAGTAYRKRSHFDGQDVLESGYNNPGGKTGWLNRAAHILATTERAKPSPALSLGYSAPLIMRGPAPVMSWAPQAFPQPGEDTINRVLELYDAQAPDLANALRRGVKFDEGQMPEDKQAGGLRKVFLRQIDQTVKFFADPDGPRIAALSSGGWDTHASQKPVNGRFATLLKILDEGIARLSKGLAPIWDDTVIVIVTEFGRTAAINGTRGTDHGTGTTAFLIGGGVKGGRVLSDWPGLDSRNLFEGRDLRATTQLNGVFKGILSDHLGMEKRHLDNKVFPQSSDIAPIAGLLA